MMKLFNSRSGTLETLNENDITMYMCGPTVYSRVHIGNLRSFLFGDIVYRTLSYMGKNVNYVMNITDVDDKIIKLVNNNIPNGSNNNANIMLELTRKYEDLFITDLKTLRIALPKFQRVSDNMDQIGHMILKLIETGDAYVTEDGSVYYDTSKNSHIYKYFNIHINNDNYESERNIMKSAGVKNINDFVLWKSYETDKLKNKGIKWKLPGLVEGRPGWHIECSAISKKHLSNVLIHLGGEDLKFPHHTNEIAQSESYEPTNVFGKYWLHVSYLQMENEKMSKSLGNVVYLDDLVQKYHPIVIRLYIITKHYRKTLYFSHEELDKYVEKVNDIYRTISRLYNFIDNDKNNNKKGTLDKNFISNLEKDVIGSVLNDFNLNSGFSFWELYSSKIREVKTISKKDAISIINLFKEIDSIFDIIEWDRFDLTDVQARLNLRNQLRKEKKYHEADEIRAEIQKEWILEDDSTGYIIFRSLNNKN